MKYNISFEATSLIFSIILLIVHYSVYHVKTKTNNFYRKLAWALVISTMLDIVTAVLISYPTNISLFFHYTLNVLYLLSGAATEYYTLKFVEAAYRHKTLAWMKYSVRALFIVYSLLVITSPLTKLVFYFDENKIYTPGLLYVSSYFLPAVTCIVIFYFIFHHRNEFPLRHRLSNYSFVATLVMATFLQSRVIPDALLMGVAGTIAAYLMLFTLETPDYIELEHLKNHLEEEVKEKTAYIEQLSLRTIEALANAVDAKDEYTRGHSVRVAAYAKALSKKVGYTDTESSQLYYAAVLHDVGKIGIPDEILNKKGKLDSTEYDVIKSHTSKGGQILQSVGNLPKALDVAIHHHERFDGKGYPQQLSEKNIMLDARIVAIADSFDAMNSDRVYRPKLPMNTIIEELEKNAGAQFDPELVPLFVKLIRSGELQAIENSLAG